MAAAGDQAEEILEKTVKDNKGKYICIAEGAIPTKDNGVYGKVHGKTFMEIARTTYVRTQQLPSVWATAPVQGDTGSKAEPHRGKERCSSHRPEDG